MTLGDLPDLLVRIVFEFLFEILVRRAREESVLPRASVRWPCRRLNITIRRSLICCCVS
jgi:hypothetical protein